MSWRKARSKDTNAERMGRINRSTREDMQNRPSMDSQEPSMEHIAGPIEVCCRADGVFGQDSVGSWPNTSIANGLGRDPILMVHDRFCAREVEGCREKERMARGLGDGEESPLQRVNRRVDESDKRFGRGRCRLIP